MSKDQLIGAVILVASVVGIVVYGWLLYLFSTLVLQVTAFVAVALILGILAWIGWTMATTPPPMPIDFAQQSGAASTSTEPQEKSSEGKS